MKSEYYEDTEQRDEVMKAWRLGNCENFVGKREELVFDAFIDSEPVERAQDGSDMGRLTSFNDSTSKRVLDLLETG